jgi:hypothetical protein
MTLLCVHFLMGSIIFVWFCLVLFGLFGSTWALFCPRNVGIQENAILGFKNPISVK